MEPVTKKASGENGRFAAHAAARAEAYTLLASLLAQAPSEALLETLRNLQWDESLPEALDRTLEGLCRAAKALSFAAVQAEFHKLFVGLGRGEMVPYGSWYLEKSIQSAPLALLRSDLMELGIVRQKDCHESEDHAGALCEIMAILSQQPHRTAAVEQAKFFDRHVTSWMIAFFEELGAAKSAEFYGAVGRFGRCFLEAEKEYLNP